ncbi:alpha/beta hydrolase [Aurantimonas sp. A2-1-M11]|uniref:alpha/beta hydrolase n=1 Tax=Aurantimonas sp. A2-1-M11 TaxID=3113712 RepID=UPI002F925049
MNEAFNPNDLVVTETNPAPAGIAASSLRAPDGKRLRYAISPSALERTRGTVILLQGRNETIEKYFETIGELNRLGYMVATFDWRGQGGSERMLRDRRRGYVRKFGAYVNDLDAFIQDIVLPDCRGPFVILAHSMGALVALTASPRLVNTVERMVLSAPLVAFPPTRLIGTRGLHRLARLARWLGLGRMSVAPSLLPGIRARAASRALSSDPGRLARNRELAEAAPFLFLDKPTVSWLAAVTGAMRRLEDSDNIARLGVPTLIVTAGEDSVVDSRTAERLAWRMRSGSSLTIPYARHELLQEADRYRAPFLEAFESFTAGALPLE